MKGRPGKRSNNCATIRWGKGNDVKEKKKVWKKRQYKAGEGEVPAERGERNKRVSGE